MELAPGPIIKKRTLKKKNPLPIIPGPTLSLNFQANTILPEVRTAIPLANDLLSTDNILRDEPSIARTSKNGTSTGVRGLSGDDISSQDKDKPPILKLETKSGPTIKIKKPRVGNPTRTVKQPNIPEKPKRERKKTVKFQKNIEVDINIPPHREPQPMNDITDMAKKKAPIEPNEIIEENKENAILLKKEYDEYIQNATSMDTEYDFLYPHLNDPNFIVKLSKHKEFYDTQYDGQVHPIEKQAEILCNSSFELMPHQIFVKNFLSMQTPYNSLLLYHGLGSGKTCSSIGIAEEMRSYMKQLNITKRMLVIASPNVQANFRLQLFDETKLEYIQGRDTDEGFWNINSCVGNSLITEINPTNLKGLSRERVVSSIKRIINNSYLFMGYIQLTNYIFNAIKKSADIESLTKQQRKKLLIKHIRELFDNRLIIIDEVHNIRISDDNKERKKTAVLLMKVAKYSQNMRLLLLSATPMFNSYQEIVWLANLMNINDKRATIKISDVFNGSGEWKPAKQLPDGSMTEDGRSLLIRKLTGYISYVRGENPYTFPYRIYPSQFAETANVLLNHPYPSTQMNGSPISEEDCIHYIDIFTTKLSDTSIQYKGYMRILEEMKTKSTDQYTATGKLRKMPAFEDMESFGYTTLQLLIESLNIVYPHPRLENPPDSNDDETEIAKVLVGETGLRNTMRFVEETQNMMQLKHKFSYKPEIKEPIFSPTKVSKYSAKIHEICNCIRQGTGIVIIYSQYIDGGLVPMALALESMGFSRFGSTPNTPNLFETPPADLVDYKMKARKKDTAFHPAKYVMITGDKAFSHNNAGDIKVLTHPDNKDGKNIKVVLLSRAGAEGLDFKNIRQVHIMEPWYNMNRVEQIIGRAVRNLSHCKLPFIQRNVEIYLHGTILPDKTPEESVDLYVYRYAEKKAIQIGEITRVLKSISVDCILNIGQTNFSVKKLLENASNQNITIELSRYNQEIPFQIGDRPFSEMCDYMGNCEYTCSPASTITKKDIRNENYNNSFAQTNQSRIIARIRELFRDKMPNTEDNALYLNHVYYEREHLINAITIVKQYPIEQIYSALSTLINNKNEYLMDAYGRTGRLIDKYDANTDTAYYVFQPIEITDENASIYERTTPIEYKREAISVEIDTSDIKKDVAKNTRTDNPVPDASEGPYGPGAADVRPATPQPTGRFSEIMGTLDSCFTGRPNADPDESTTGVFNTTTLRKGRQEWYEHAGMIFHYSKPGNQYPEKVKTKGEGRSRIKKTDVQIVYHDLPIQQLRSDFGITDEIFEKYIVLHFLETLLFPDKLEIIKHFFNENNIPGSPREQIIYTYLEERLVKSEDSRGILTIKDDTLVLLMQNTDTGEWMEGDQEDYSLMAGELRRFQQPRTAKTMFSLIGFITPFVSKKTNQREMVFKVKDMTEKRNNIGARIDDAGKDKVIKILNTLVGSPKYTDKNTEFVPQLGICIVIEIIMRLFSDQSRDGKHFYLSPEHAILSEVIKKSFSS